MNKTKNLRIYRVPYYVLLDLIQNYGELPEDSRVTDVCTDFDSGDIKFKVSHPDFDLVSESTLIPSFTTNITLPYEAPNVAYKEALQEILNARTTRHDSDRLYLDIMLRVDKVIDKHRHLIEETS